MLIRTAVPDDAKELSEIYSYYVENYPYSFEYESPSAEEFSQRITETLKFFPFFVCKENNEILGFAYAHKYKERKAYQWVCETSIYVKQDLIQKGIGTALYQQLLPALKKQGFIKAFAVLGCPNEGSEIFHVKMGFNFLAALPEMGYKFGCWHDIKYFVFYLNPMTSRLKEPIAYSEVESSTKVNEYKAALKWLSGQYDLPSEFSDETINKFTSELGSLQSIWGLCGKDISKLNFDKVSEQQFIRLAFNEYTKFPDNFKFDCKKILEESKNPGLGLFILRKNGIDGNGINVAVIDKPILETHNELTGRIKSYTLICPESEYNEKMHFHGITCAAFLCGNSCGAANRADLYYYAYPDRFEDDGMYWSYHFKALDMILKHNQNAVPCGIIRVVSISSGFPGNRTDLQNKMNEYVDKLKETGCYVIFSNLFGETFTCSSKKSCFNNDDPDTYKLDIWQTNRWNMEMVLIPAGGRTSPCNSGKNRYMYNGNQSTISWAIPYLCGVFTLALQLDKELTYAKFCEKVKKTAYVNKEGLYVINPNKLIGEL
ncbi:MAG: GNAT family N-acetyltransferase [Clostridiales bacterium]|nr:GNAT family N-acetyltransferase [Clostridiales bacterium]